jgi:hypothetical protein
MEETVMSGNAMIMSGKLTKKFYIGLPDGVFLVCSAGMSPLEPSFAEYVAIDIDRPVQWNRIREARADQIECHVYQTKEDFEEYLKGWRRRPDGRGWYRAEIA